MTTIDYPWQPKSAMSNDTPKSPRHVPPPKRSYEDRPAKRQIYSDTRALTLKALSWSLPGGFIGAAAGWYGAYVGRWNALGGVIAGFVLGLLIAFAIARVVIQGAGWLAASVLLPSGKSTPVKREYSYPASLAARGHYTEAIDAYQACCAEHSEDPEPYLQIARLYRDHVGSYDQALFWFKRARSETALTPGREIAVAREIIELYTNVMGDPMKAIPELARLVDRFPDEETSVWAKEEIARLRREGGRIDG